MIEGEWVEQGVRRINANWPHQRVPDASLAKWFDDLKDLPVGYVVSSIETIYREGDKFPPNGGQIRRKAVEMQLDAPTFAEAWQLVNKAVRHFGLGQPREAMEWLRERHVIVAVLATRVGWRDMCLSTEPSVVHGQARRVFEALETQVIDETTVRGLESGGLRKIERLNGGPVPIGKIVRGAVAA